MRPGRTGTTSHIHIPNTDLGRVDLSCKELCQVVHVCTPWMRENNNPIHTPKIIESKLAVHSRFIILFRATHCT